MASQTDLVDRRLDACFAMTDACVPVAVKASNDLAVLDAVETAARIRTRALGAAEAVGAAIDRAKRLDPMINAIAHRAFERARRTVSSAAGPWAGVPTFVKDLDDIVGLPTAFGSRAFPGYRGKQQTPLIDAFLALGVVSLGKSATPEFGLMATTEPVSKGPTRNPWNTDFSSGGSSGGAAALVAAGVVPIAHASDGGGSIRIPASCCGNVGLKLSRGRHAPALPELAEPIMLVVHGAQTRTVRDSAAIAAALEVDNGLPPIGIVTRPSAKRLRIGLWTTGANGRPVDPEVIDATRAVARLCERLGHHVSEIAPRFEPGLEEAFLLYWAKTAKGAVSLWEQATKLPRNRFAFEPFTLGLVEHCIANEGRFPGAVDRLLDLAREFAAMFSDLDVVLSPVVAAPPPKIGYFDGRLPFETLVERLLDYAQFTALYNIVGATAISLPLSMSKNSLPIGAMFGARAGAERVLLELAYELEEAAPWCGRRPAIFG